MLRFVFNQESKDWSCAMYFKLNKTKCRIQIKLDTGAAFTTVSGAIISELMDISVHQLESLFKESGIKKIHLSSAATAMYGYILLLDNVIFGEFGRNIELEKFMVIVSFNCRDDLAVLGAEFLSCCSFRLDCRKNPDIELEYVSTDGYNMRISKTSESLKVMNEDMLGILVSECIDTDNKISDI